ncbi:unnamed protein product [Spirodela intermedia]|uniref:Uncharacterized protein n=1 Tax=Spirodela intermedia TaxID=51605 RepID=A0A7I8ITN0_SPIIN|nr:unnamed protein product [Spirodela intermedia]CAA6661156.1 unnamed protein product [Spirodela intermedia]
MDEEKDKILGHLLDGSKKKRSMISIVGMGGLGKPTLAKRVFNEARAKFGHSVWIDVSQQYSLSLSFETFFGSSRAQCEEKLYETLEAENYLIVMDDVWDTEVWKILSRHLPDAQNGSRVLITTRDKKVARAADPSTPPLTPLQEGVPESGGYRSNLLRIAEEFGERNREEMRGLPLALVVLGGLLSTKDLSLWAWKRLADTLVWENMEEGRVCLDILALSYEDLPRRLKCCFLYFSSLPEDFEVNVDKLIGLWIAEGFVEQREGETLEETAEDYLEELVQRCMVILVQDDDLLRMIVEVRCRIHDLLHDFTVAEAKEVGFLVCHRIRDDGGASPLDSSVRRLSLQGNKASYWDSKSTPRLRTLLSFGFDAESDMKRTFPLFQI